MKRFIFRKEGRDWIVYDRNSEEIFIVNNTGKIILQKIEKKESKKKIISYILKNYSISREKVEKDIKDFIKKFNTYVK